MPPSRRTIIALGAALLSTGCVEAGLVFPGSDTTPDEDRCHGGVDVRTDDFDPATDLSYSLRQTGRAIVAEAATAEYVDYSTYGEPPLDADAFVTYDGTFYRTDYSIVSSERVPAFSMDVRSERERDVPADATVVAFDALPEVDRTALRAATLPEHEEELAQQFAVEGFPASYPDGGDDSRLVGTTTWVRWRDRPIRVEVADEADTTRERRTVRYTVDQVAATAAEFRQYVADRYLVRLGDLPADQRAIVEAAVDEKYEECRPQSEALAALRSRLAEGDRLPTPGRTAWYVAFDGRQFALTVNEWEH